jgi:hypothetical protein
MHTPYKKRNGIYRAITWRNKSMGNPIDDEKENQHNQAKERKEEKTIIEIYMVGKKESMIHD